MPTNSFYSICLNITLSLQYAMTVETSPTTRPVAPSWSHDSSCRASPYDSSCSHDSSCRAHDSSHDSSSSPKQRLLHRFPRRRSPTSFFARRPPTRILRLPSLCSPSGLESSGNIPPPGRGSRRTQTSSRFLVLTRPLRHYHQSPTPSTPHGSRRRRIRPASALPKYEPRQEDYTQE